MSSINWTRIFEHHKQQPLFSPMLPDGTIVSKIPNITCFVMTYAFAMAFLQDNESLRAKKLFSSDDFIKGSDIFTALSYYTRPDPAVLQSIVQYTWPVYAKNIIFIDFDPHDHHMFFSAENRGAWSRHYGYSNGNYYKSWYDCYDQSDWNSYYMALQDIVSSESAMCVFVTHITGGMRHVVAVALEKSAGSINGFVYDSLNGDFYDQRLFDNLKRRIEKDIVAVTQGTFIIPYATGYFLQEHATNIIGGVENILDRDKYTEILSVSQWFYHAAAKIEGVKNIKNTKLFHMLCGCNYEDPLLFVSSCEYFIQLTNIIFDRPHGPWSLYIQNHEVYKKIAYIDLPLLKEIAQTKNMKLDWRKMRLITHADERLKEAEHILVKINENQYVSHL